MGFVPKKGDWLAFRFRGQGATEYLVLLAVVLIIALVSIALLGFFPGISTDTKITQSASYWKAARPFAILEHSASTGTGNITLVIQNTDGGGTFTLNNMTLTSGSTTRSTTIDYTFSPGEVRSVSANASFGGATGQVYDLTVGFNYTSANGVISTQYGGKTLTGKYV